MGDRGEGEKESKKCVEKKKSKSKKDFEKGKYQEIIMIRGGGISLELLTKADKVKPDRVFLVLFFWERLFCFVDRILFYFI